MEVYILDSLFRRVLVVDNYESLISTERFSAWGDFELDVTSTLENRTRYVPGLRIAIQDSYRVMIVETVEEVTDSEGRRIIKVKGRSLEKILEDRLAMVNFTDLTEDPKWELTGVPVDIANFIFHDICILGLVDPGDIISGVTEASIFPPDTIGAPTDEIVYSFEPISVYQALKSLCDAYAMGFRLIRDGDTSLLYWDVYMGSDRTSSQTTLPAVIFSSDMDNLVNTSKLSSDALYKNAAYVVSKVGHEIVYPVDIDPTIAGFERRVLFVKADDIDDPDPDIASAQMIQRGKEELAKSRRYQSLDGEVSQSSLFKYGVDYNLGDLVELRDDDGATSQMQVTEHIVISDQNGIRSYPTLTVNVFITPGSWLGWDFNQVWDDVDDSEHWADQL